MANRDQHPHKPKGNGVVERYDAVIIGAGFGGLYATAVKVGRLANFMF